MSSLTIEPGEEQIRLDKLLSLRYPGFSRSYFEYLIEEGSVLVNGSRRKKREMLEVGDEIEVCFMTTPEVSFEPEDIPLDILYEDEHLLAINKPVGLVVHPGAGHWRGTFLNALLHHCKTLAVTPENNRPGIVHRLDKDTSGVLLAAKTETMHRALVSLFCNREIEKTYLAICIGNPGDGLIDAPLARHPIYRKQMVVAENGKEAKSFCKVLSNDGDLTVVQVELITGRTHQIRAHLKYRGTPVLGDPVYGSLSANKTYSADRQLLHAERISFYHPITKQKLTISAPIPTDMLKFLGK
jgi:23S rRNA pseudouridine1911/1915/1917 synthase